MLMTIAPSKTQVFPDSLCVEATQAPLLRDSELLIRELQKLSVAELAHLMKMSERLALQTYQRIHAFELPFTGKNSRCAMAVFQGDVYSHIPVQEYGIDDISYINSHLCILSGLYGILRPLDLMQTYRLEMGCRLENTRGKNLYEFWGDKVTDEVSSILDGHLEPVLVNLASSEYSRVIRKKCLRGSLLQIDFKEGKGKHLRTVAIHAKRARGMMVDFAVKNRVETVTQLKDFREAGYTFRPDLSTVDHYCFTREGA